MSQLPIDEALPALKQALNAHSRVVLQAPPGAGKTTRIPLALLDEPWLAGQSILMLEPRRLAARSAAGYMAQVLGEEPGQQVGYRIRLERRVSRATRVEVITEGILTRRLQDDPMLEGVGLVIFDEFHERHLDSDLALALCLDAQRSLRDDLRLLVMSATLDGNTLANTLAAPLVESMGRSYPVDIHYLPRDPQGGLAAVATQAVVRALDEQDGDMLVFLPGAGEIRQSLEALGREAACEAVLLVGLYGDLGLAQQRQAILPDPQGRRKVVLATNIAETSLTIEGVSTVIDSGWQRVPRFDPRSGLTRLERVRVSQASATQRAGRAGRLGPGVCYRLWGENTQRGLVPYNPPEIATADLAPLALELALWGVQDAAGLTWIDPPPPGSLSQARELLTGLDAIDAAGRITAEGRALAELPLHPRLAHMVHAGKALGHGALACDIAALLSERDIFAGREARSLCDFSLRLEALWAFRRKGGAAARRLGAEPAVLSRLERSASLWRKRLRLSETAPESCHTTTGLLLALAYPDRIARLRDNTGERYLMSGGRGALLDVQCDLTGTRWLVAASLDARGAEGRIRLAAPVDFAALQQHLPHLLTESERVYWDRDSAAVLARFKRRLGAIVLESRPLEHPEPQAVQCALLEGIRHSGLACLPWNREASELRARIMFLQRHFPDQGWPELDDSTLLGGLEQWLAPYLSGMGRLSDLGRLRLGEILAAMLDWEARQRLEEGAPATIQVPSGNRRHIDYGDEQGPVLAVKLQELFGLEQTPTVAWGKVPLTLHLLSPARRPIQVTRDLKSFWQRTYPEVKKELKGRYPKHPWPDDPFSAQPTAGTKRRPRD